MFDPNEWVKETMKLDPDYPAVSTQNKRLRRVFWELISELQQVELLPADFFDRPQLAAVLSAVQQIKEEGK